MEFIYFVLYWLINGTERIAMTKTITFGFGRQTFNILSQYFFLDRLKASYVSSFLNYGNSYEKELEGDLKIKFVFSQNICIC